MIVDYHMHLRGPRAADGSEPLLLSADNVERYVLRALAQGAHEIAFTEHVYYFRQTEGIWRSEYHRQRCRFDLDRYAEAVLEAQRRGLPVKLGVEVDYVAERQDELAAVLAAYPLDLVLGSVHEAFDLPLDLEPGVWQAHPVEEVWRAYVRDVAALAHSGHVDVIAHPDLVKIFGHRPGAALLAELHEALAAELAAAGVAAEISTAGLRKPVGELYPDPQLLAAFRRHGVPITTASDAHLAELAGYELAQAAAFARSAGYETVSVFDRRSRRQEPLG